MHVLGTHDIHNVSVTSPLPGQIRVTGDFVDGSTATGIILIIYSLNNNSNVHYIDKDKEQRSVSVIVSLIIFYGLSFVLIVIWINYSLIW